MAKTRSCWLRINAICRQLRRVGVFQLSANGGNLRTDYDGRIGWRKIDGNTVVLVILVA
jgi:hypothetical protein